MLCTKEYNTLYLDAQPLVQDVKKTAQNLHLIIKEGVKS